MKYLDGRQATIEDAFAVKVQVETRPPKMPCG
jgi:hypothetical protein